jgi:signal transduction histidine kinase
MSYIAPEAQPASLRTSGSRTVHAGRLLTIIDDGACRLRDDDCETVSTRDMQRLVDSACEAASRSAIEAERARMAGEIHDGLAQAFLAVMMQARAARLGGRLPKQRLLHLLEQIECLAAGGLEESRRSVFALRSTCVESDGLVRALDRLVGSLSIAGRTRFILVNRAGAPDISPGAEDAVYRIVQEATQNALKHAGAREVTVQLERDDGQLRVRIEDDGEGVAHDVIQRARERGGLRAMRDRAERCGGSLIVEPCSPRGTRVDVLLPMRNPPA